MEWADGMVCPDCEIPMDYDGRDDNENMIYRCPECGDEILVPRGQK